MRIYPTPKQTLFSGEEYIFGKLSVLTVGKDYCTQARAKLFQEFFKNFTGGVGHLQIVLTDEPTKTAVLSKTQCALHSVDTQGEDYCLKIDGNGATIGFNDENSFARAFYTLLASIEVRNTYKGQEEFTLPIGEIKDSPVMGFRAVHFCVFQETRRVLLKKFIRLAAFLKYSHIVIEFWGTFRYQCCKYLSRKGAYTHADVKKLTAEASALGLQVIPMLNIFGHAAQSRALFGKHVVLDQAPWLAPLFDPSGWVWNIQNPEVKKLQEKMIDELLSCCGDGEYFLIGCDEPDGFGDIRTFHGKDKIKICCDYINSMSARLKKSGRQAMMWADMLLWPNPEWKGCSCHGESLEQCERMLSELDKEIVLIDWEYNTLDENLPTSKYLADHGFEVVVAPWKNVPTTKIVAKNIKENGYKGMMLTTWNSISQDIFILPTGAIYAWNDGETAEYLMHGVNVGEENQAVVITSYLRRLYDVKGRYHDSGIKLTEIDK